jgi:hypothetical protein
MYGGFLLYLVGILYSFVGISLVTQNYINPAIDTIKKKGIVSNFQLLIIIDIDRFRHNERNFTCLL